MNERITKAKCKIQVGNPFFSYLSLGLNFIETEEIETMGINMKMDLAYNPKFIDTLTDSELVGCITHELFHIILMTALRIGTREHRKFNIASDIVINNLLIKNKYSLPEIGYIPKEDRIKIGNVLIEDIESKTAEEVYDEIKDELKDGEDSFDVVDYDTLSDGERRELEKQIKDKIISASVFAKQRGNMPVGLERIVDELHKEKFNWKTLLRKYIQNEIPFDTSWNRPSKKSIGCGCYLPSPLKEKIDIGVCIDLSGSIGEEEYRDFMSEIIGITNGFGNVDLHFFSHDTEAYYFGKVNGKNKQEVINIKLKGGGGTSHKEVIDLINTKKIKFCVFFTDGFSDIEEIDLKKYKYDKLFVISKDGKELNGVNCIKC